ncbi:MAG TPA: MraY family glycosyltransferase [Dehalococcoidia bacterium]|nr:MraY family glycosyltransferase [Dehalococcoidia bacterium]
MTVELLSLSVAFVAAVALTTLLRVRTAATPRGIISFPTRRVDDMPRIGGIAIFLAFLITPIIVASVSNDASERLSDDWREVAGFGASGGLVLLLGIFDDIRIAHFRQKLAVQIVAALLLYVSGFRIEELAFPGNLSVDLGWSAPFMTIVWVVGVSNAVNLIDGKDGVATGVSAIVAGTLMLTAWNMDNALAAMLFATLTGSVLGFLPFNFPPASRYLGDSGALFLGFAIAALSIKGSVNIAGHVFLGIPLVALGFPIVDTVLAATRRLADGRHPMLGDEDHIHHRLASTAGLGPRSLALATYGLTGLFAAAALILHFVPDAVGLPLVIGLVGMTIAALLTWLGYPQSFWDSAVSRAVRRVPPREAMPPSVLTRHPRRQSEPRADESG